MASIAMTGPSPVVSHSTSRHAVARPIRRLLAASCVAQREVALQFPPREEAFLWRGKEALTAWVNMEHSSETGGRCIEARGRNAHPTVAVRRQHHDHRPGQPK